MRKKMSAFQEEDGSSGESVVAEQQVSNLWWKIFNKTIKCMRLRVVVGDFKILSNKSAISD